MRGRGLPCPSSLRNMGGPYGNHRCPPAASGLGGVGATVWPAVALPRPPQWQVVFLRDVVQVTLDATGYHVDISFQQLDPTLMLMR